MSIQKKLLLIFLFITVPVLLLLEVLNFFEHLKRSEGHAFEEHRANFNTLLTMQKQSIALTAMELATDDMVKKAYRENNPQLLIDKKLPFWNAVKKERLIHEIHFFKPPAVSFVNFSDFSSIGKDVSDVRSDITWITSSFKSSSHLMMCKTYAGVRATYPIIDDDGTMLGGLSVGKKVDWLPESFKKLTGTNALIVYTKDAAQKLASEYYKNFIKGKSFAGDLIMAERTFDIGPEEIDQIDFTKEIQEISLNGERHTVNIFTLYEFDQRKLGYLLVFNNIGDVYSDFFKHLAKVIAILLVATLFFLLLIRHNFSVFKERIGEIRLLSNAYRKKDFTSLDNANLEALKNSPDRDEISNLKKDIILMGASLRYYYNELEDEVDKKTRQLYTLNAQLLKQLYTDGLTGIPNRNAFFRDLEQMSTPLLAIININNFKNINDIYGIDIGNELIKDSIKLIEKLAKEHGLSYYRLGSDETALLHNNIDPDAFKETVMSIINSLEAHTFDCQKESAKINIDYTVGISFEKENIVEKADMALVAARRHHQKCHIYHDKLQLRKLHFDNIELTNKIRHAVNNDGIIPYFQPIVDRNGTILKYEALARMMDGNALLKPFQFLDLAMKTRYYEEITNIIIAKTFAYFKEQSCGFSVNLHAVDMINEQTVARIYALLEEYPDPSRVIFEIIESESIANLEEVELFITKVKQYGAKIAIDDFGSGYSNFSYLLKLRPDYLKIDGSLIKPIDSDRDAYAITKTIVSFAKTLGITTIAEFIHSEKVFDVAVELGVDQFQGFYFSEPVGTLYTDGTLPQH